MHTEQADQATPQPAAPLYTLRFTHWQCGHHGTRPADIEVHTPDQALLICEAISHAISQGGNARAVLIDGHQGFQIYITDDSISANFGSDWAADKLPMLSSRPILIHGDEATVVAILADDLKAARDDAWLEEDLPDLDNLTRWDGIAAVYADDVLVTTQPPEAIQAAIDVELANSWEDREPLFQLPPVFVPAAVVLAKLQEMAADQRRREAESEAQA